MNAQPTDGFIKWQPINAHYVDPEAMRAAMFDQSARTVGGNVAEFQIYPTDEPVTDYASRRGE